MANYDKIPFGLLFAYQQSIEMASIGMKQHLEAVFAALNEGAVGQVYYDELLKSSQRRVDKNNDIDDELAKEIRSRMIKTFGRDVTTPDHLDKLKAEFEVQLKKREKLVEGRAEITEQISKKHGAKGKPVKQLDLSVSKEKKA